ncbi:hypothetical protein [Pelagibius sp.]|uniref:hypothetical protein n=1 Tax=Pelagibius sp. TaxID=1931238 RepID=UPI003BB091EC
MALVRDGMPQSLSTRWGRRTAAVRNRPPPGLHPATVGSLRHRQPARLDLALFRHPSFQISF